MKTAVIKFVCSAFATMFMMSSCLGDGESSYESERDFAFITTNNGKKCAAASAGYVSHDVIRNLSEGECYYIKYKIKTSVNTGGVYEAETAQVLDGGSPIAKGQFFYKKQPFEGISDESRKDSIAPTSLIVGPASPTDYFGDRWLFTYRSSLKSDDKVEAYFYYDDKNQKNEIGEDLVKNQIIIDVRFIKTVKDQSGEKPVSAQRDIIVDLSDLREMYIPTYDSSEKVVDVVVKFRYQKYDAEGKPATISWLGAWNNNNGSTPVYFLRYELN